MTTEIIDFAAWLEAQGKEDNSNKVTSISSSSTNDQYPSAKAVYDYIDDLIGDIVEDMLQ
jgi:hypothetical protein